MKKTAGDYEKIIRDLHKRIAKLEAPCCPYCGDKEQLVIDHIIPKSKGGNNEKENLEKICWRCNTAKWNSSKEDFVAWIKRLIKYQRKINR